MSERRPLGNVLVAMDFSAIAMHAVERAAQLPIGGGSALTVLHVVPPDSSPEDRIVAERALDYAATRAAESAARVGRKDLDVFARLAEGTPFVEIVRAARHSRSELIVVGRHGKRTFRDLVLGSTAERVIRKGDTSILVVASRPATLYERPLVAVDCSDTSRRAVELAWLLVDPRVQTLEVVNAYRAFSEKAIADLGFSGEAALEYHREAKDQAQAAVDAFLAAGEAPVPATVVLGEGDARQVILDVAAARGADLLALGTHGRSGVAHVLLGSVAEAVIRGARCDVLVARAAGLRFELP